MVIFVLFILFSLSLQSEEWTSPELIKDLSSSKEDYSPSFNKYLNRFYFASDRSGKSNLYHCDYPTFANSSYIKGGINLTSKNSNYITFLNQNKAVFSSFRMGERQAYQNLYYSTYQKQSWAKGDLIGELSGDYFVSHPTVSPDGNTMIFSSNKDSEQGDSDLYICYRSTDGTWEKPILLDEINSPGFEITPFFSSSDTLYFASDGQGGEGGFDIFVSIKELGLWQRPKPVLGVNSSSNDSDPCRINNILVFSSDRVGGLGGLDLYRSNLIDETTKLDNSDQITKPIPEFSLTSETIQIEVLQEYIRTIDVNELGEIVLIEKTVKSDIIIYPKRIKFQLKDYEREDLLARVSSKGIILQESRLQGDLTIELTLLASNLINSDNIECSVISPIDIKSKSLSISKSTNKKIKYEEIENQNIEIVRIENKVIEQSKYKEILDIVNELMNSGIYKDYKISISEDQYISLKDAGNLKNIFEDKIEIQSIGNQSMIMLYRSY